MSQPPIPGAASPLAIAEWIEIPGSLAAAYTIPSPLAIAEWIEINPAQGPACYARSPLAIAEWIEIIHIPVDFYTPYVSASDSGVD